ncbi:hypothetical protein GCM10027065_02520 [Rhodanobacter koreensis]
MGNFEEAVKASDMGFAAAILIAAVNAIIATASLIGHTTILGIGPGAYVDAAVFAIVAYGIRLRSSTAAVVGLGLFAVEKICQFAIQPKSLLGLSTTIFLLCAFISGVRGTFAYHRLAPENAAKGESLMVLGVNLRKPLAIWVTALLSALILWKTTLGWIHTFETLYSATPGASTVAGGDLLSYVLRVASLALSAMTLYAIVRKPGWGHMVCALFSVAFVAIVVIAFFHQNLPVTFAARVATCALICAPLALFLNAVCLGRTSKAYFENAAIDPKHADQS